MKLYWKSYGLFHAQGDSLTVPYPDDGFAFDIFPLKSIVLYQPTVSSNKYRLNQF